LRKGSEGISPTHGGEADGSRDKLADGTFASNGHYCSAEGGGAPSTFLLCFGLWIIRREQAEDLNQLPGKRGIRRIFTTSQFLQLRVSYRCNRSKSKVSLSIAGQEISGLDI